MATRPATDLTPWTRATVADLLRQTGHALTLDDWPLVAELNDADLATASPATPENAELLRRPTWVRGVALWPLTIGLAEWLNEAVVPWLRHDARKLGLAMAWSLTLDRPHETLCGIEGPDDLWRVVKAWSKACRWTQADLEHVLGIWFPDDAGPPSREGPGPLVGLLAREYRMEPDWILNQAGEGLIRTLVEDFTRRQEAEARAASRGRGKGRVARVTPTAVGLALQRRIRARRAILEAWSAPSSHPVAECAKHSDSPGSALPLRGTGAATQFPSPVPGMDG